MSFPPGTEMFQFPGFACWSLCIQPNIPRPTFQSCSPEPKSEKAIWKAVKVGFPIRKFVDQRVLAPPHNLSQRATSFIASQCQGIRQKPLFA